MDLINKWSLLDDIAVSMSAGMIFQRIRNPRGFDVLPFEFWAAELAAYPMPGFYVYFTFAGTCGVFVSYTPNKTT